MTQQQLVQDVNRKLDLVMEHMGISDPEAEEATDEPVEGQEVEEAPGQAPASTRGRGRPRKSAG
jgi:hypothetical protein